MSVSVKTEHAQHDWVLDEVQVSSHKHLGTTGGQLWPAAVRCTEYLAGMCSSLGLDAPGARILELGAGLGFLGLNLARNLPRAAEICLTEQASGGALDWLRHNIQQNQRLPNMTSVTSRECDWTDFAPDAETLATARTSLAAQEPGLVCCGSSSPQAIASKQGGSHCSPDAVTGAPNPQAPSTLPVQVASSQQPSETSPAAANDSSKLPDLRQLLSTRWDFIVGSDLIYNHIGSRLLPHVIKHLSHTGTVTYYCHSRHRFDHLDVEFLEQVSAVGLVCEEVREPWLETPPPSPPAFSLLFPDLRIAVYKITPAAQSAGSDGAVGRA